VAEIGYGIVPSRRGRGYATEAVTTLIAAAWHQPSLWAVIADTDHDNIGSQRVLGKAGFVLIDESTGLRSSVSRPPG
jgi:[ribosomal protein S5]-alanine N-acetyltransferase